jgi:rhodanese-related sulfurtransferase
MKKLLPVLLFAFNSCASDAQVTALKPNEYASAIQSSQIQVLDARTADEYKSGHLNNALQANWLNRAEFEDRTQHLDKNKPVYIYCLSGGRSAAAGSFLASKGYKVINLEGGINAWKMNNLPVAGGSNIPQTTMDAYMGQVQSTTFVLVDFGAEWCPPCRKMEPVLESFMKANKGKLTLVKMDGGVEDQLMKSLKVEALPTFILYKNGKEVIRKQGLVTQEEFTSWLK